MEEIQEFRNWLSILGYSPQRIEQYPRAVERMLESTSKCLRELLREDLLSYVEDLKSRDLRASYINTQITAIRTFGRFIYQAYRYSLPTGHLLYCKVQQRFPSVLSEQEVLELFETTDNTKYGYRDRAMLSLCYAGGLRRKEAIDLHVRDLDLKRGYILVREGKNHKERIVPIPPLAVQHIKEYLIHARPFFKKGKTHQRDLFLGYRGSKVSSQVFEKRIRMLASKTNNEPLIQKRVTLHLLRHSIATHLLYRGVALEHVSQFLGHSNLASTQVYTHIKPP